MRIIHIWWVYKQLGSCLLLFHFMQIFPAVACKISECRHESKRKANNTNCEKCKNV